MFFIFPSRIARLIILIYALVFMLHQKSGNFLEIFKTLFSNSHKRKTRLKSKI